MTLAQQTEVKGLQHKALAPVLSRRASASIARPFGKSLAQDDFSPQPPPLRAPRPSTRDPYYAVMQQGLAEDAQTFYKQRPTTTEWVLLPDRRCPGIPSRRPGVTMPIASGSEPRKSGARQRGARALRNPPGLPSFSKPLTDGHAVFRISTRKAISTSR